jgi:opacity protein-like surface antigen
MSSRQLLTTVLTLLVAGSTSLFAQSERPTEIFVGYANLQAEGLANQNDPNNFLSNDFFNRRTTMHGLNAGVTFFPFDLFGVTGDVSYNRNNRDVALTNGANSENMAIWHFLAGPSLTLPSTARLQPFARGMVGVAHTSFEREQERRLAGGTASTSFDVGSTDFAMALGAGIDVVANDKIKVRVIQIDYMPVYLGDRAVTVFSQAGAIQPVQLEGQRLDNLRFSFGIIF